MVIVMEDQEVPMDGHAGPGGLGGRHGGQGGGYGGPDRGPGGQGGGPGA